jgi:hypothetical protein
VSDEGYEIHFGCARITFAAIAWHSCEWQARAGQGASEIVPYRGVADQRIQPLAWDEAEIAKIDPAASQEVKNELVTFVPESEHDLTGPALSLGADDMSGMLSSLSY